MWALAHLFTEREEATQNAKQVGMNHSTKIFYKLSKVNAGWHHSTKLLRCQDTRGVFTPTCNLLFRGSWERLEAESLPQWEPGEGSGREAFILCRTKASRHGERGNKPGYPRAEVRTTEAKVVYMKKLSSCLENQCDGRPSSSHPGHTMTEVGSYELGWWDGK